MRSRASTEREQAETRALTTERLLLQVQMLLERYGLVSREMIAAEGLSGGFGPYYKVLKQLEEGGRVRRGYFVEGLAGAQFALPAAVERLRAARLDETPVEGFGDAEVLILSAVDPANPYGALLSWPESGGRMLELSARRSRDAGARQLGAATQQRTAGLEPPRSTEKDDTGADAGTVATSVAMGTVPKRIAGAWVILVVGKPVLYLTASGRQLLTFPDSITDDGHELVPALAAVPRVPSSGRKRRLIQHIDGIPALESPLREALLAAGFEVDHDALVPAHFSPDAASARRTQGRDKRH
ncbi:MAG: hypothetical protein GVY22_12340 [Gammaproteobacteria bacterium]|nr:hypothetical protein [Gammaproteobacteria bacterium]